MNHIKITCNIKGNNGTRSCKSPAVPKISLQVYRTRIWKRKKWKPKKGKFTFSEGMKGQFAGNVQEVNSLSIPNPKKVYCNWLNTWVFIHRYSVRN